MTTWLIMAIEPQIQALVSNNSAEIGEVIHLQVAITTPLEKRSPQIKPPKFPRELPFRISVQQPYTQQQRNYSIINGKAQDNSCSTTVYVYNLIPQQAGSFTIPALTYNVNGEDLTTEPITLNIGAQARNASATADMTITQEFTPSRSVIGSTIKGKWQIVIPANRSILHVIPQFPFDALKQYFKLPDSIENLAWKSDDTTKIINGKPYRIFTSELDLIPRSDGSFTIPGAFATIVVRDDNQRRNSRQRLFGDDDFFDNAFSGVFGGGRTRELTIISEDSTVTIAPLPTTGRPDDFSGLLGQLKIDVKAEPTDVSVGDPILLTVTLNNVTLLENGSVPDLQKNSAFATSFRVSGDDPAVTTNDTIVFQRTIRAINDKVTAIPAITIPYYDTTRECYGTASSEPIPITVAAAKQITLADAAGNGAKHNDDRTANDINSANDGATATSSAKRAANNDWLPNHDSTTGSAYLCARSKLLASPVISGLAIAPPAAWILLALLKLCSNLRSCNPAQRASRNARKNFLRAINHLTDNTPDAAGIAYAALQNYIIAQYSLAGNAVTHNDIDALTIPDASRDNLKSLLTQCENAKFAGAQLNLREFKTLARKCAS